MALTATIRNLVMGLLALILSLPAVQPVITGLETVGFTITPEFLSAVSLAIAGTVSTFILGLVTYTVNKLGSKWPIVNLILSLGRAKTGAIYVPNDQREVTAIATAAGKDTVIVGGNRGGTEILSV